MADVGNLIGSAVMYIIGFILLGALIGPLSEMMVEMMPMWGGLVGFIVPIVCICGLLVAFIKDILGKM